MTVIDNCTRLIDCGVGFGAADTYNEAMKLNASRDFRVEEQIRCRLARAVRLYRLTKQSLGTLEAVEAIIRSGICRSGWRCRAERQARGDSQYITILWTAAWHFANKFTARLPWRRERPIRQRHHGQPISDRHSIWRKANSNPHWPQSHATVYPIISIASVSVLSVSQVYSSPSLGASAITSNDWLAGRPNVHDLPDQGKKNCCASVGPGRI
jgi:hypothetical protein